MGQTVNKKGNMMYYIHSIIFVLMTFGIGFLPPIGGITELGMKVLGIFIGLFIWLDFYWFYLDKFIWYGYVRS